jgi:putative membrane protein
VNVLLRRRTSEREPHPSEQRDHLANVRTLLAWVRTAITIMAFGFVVAKFGILLRELPGTRAHESRLPLHVSAIIGTTLVLIGAVFLVLATIDFLIVRRQIERQVIAFSPTIHLLLTGILFLVAIGLAVYLLLTA